ncbi:MAG: class I SAM-dependent methyltransferase [Bacillota bacterium]|nr:class I SAM-dependent methyltransferase [Bacillota bacterium]
MIENPGPMMQLSDRLQAMADRVPLGDRMADIGTDHGHLPVYLFEREHSPFVVMTDISAPSLEKAKRAAGAYQFGGGMSFRLGSGLEVLEPGEVDTVVIAGMGGKLIRDILSADPEKTRSYSRFVLQPRTAAGALRKWLLEAGFRIFSEDIVEEGHFFPEVITAGKKENRVLDSRDLAEMHRGILAGLSEDHIFFRVPPWIARAGGPVEKYLLRRLDQERRVREGLQAAREQDGMRINAIQENILYLEKLLKQVRAGQQPG